MTPSLEATSSELVQLRIPGLPQYLGVVRLTTAGLANKLDVPFDDAEDLKLAVTEVCSHILRSTRVRVDLCIDFRLVGRRFEMRIAGQVSEPRRPVGPTLLQEFGRDLDPEVGMSLVEALMDHVDVSTDPESGEISVTMARSLESR